MAQNLQVTKNTYDKVAITFTTDSLYVENVSVPEGVFSTITMQGYDVSNNPGAPQLPLLTKLLQIPVCDSVVVNIVNAEYKEYDVSDFGITHPLFPSQPSVSKSEVNPPFVYDQAIYSTDAFYALPLVQVEKAGIRRDLALANVYVSPIQYNPVTKRIRIYNIIDVEFTFVNTDMSRTHQLQSYASPMFGWDNTMLLNEMPNPVKTQPEFTQNPIKYLIVAHSMFSGNTNLEAFIEWKRRLGYKVEIAYTSNSSVGTTTTSIQSFIQNKYNNATAADPAPTFLLLIGDVAQIPAFTGQSDNSHVTDLYYATLAGNDNIPDCYYGRLSATNSTELKNQLDKIMMYEQYTMPDPSYLGNAVLIAGVDDTYSTNFANGQINYAANYYVNTNSTTHQYTQVHTHLYPYSNVNTESQTIRNEVSAGAGWVNYTAHGSETGWYSPSFQNSHVSSMTNANKYGLMIGNCCKSGTFNYSSGDCFGETLLKAQNKGAMGYIGASNYSYWYEDVYWAVGVRSSISSSMSYQSSNLGMYDKAFHTHNEAQSVWVSTIGGILYGGNVAVQSSSSSRKLYYWEIYHCFGDPSVRVYLGMPNTMTVVADDITLGDIQYTVQAVPYAYVALKKNTTTFVAAAFANASGVATLTLPSDLEPGIYELVALAQNYIWYHQDIEVIESSSCISPSNFTVSNVTPYTANLSWTGESGSVYNIELKTGNANWVSVATGITATSYTLTGLQDDVEYTARVQSVCGNNETSNWRSVIFATPVACPVPTELVCAAYTPTTATLNWTENGSANQWTLQYGTNSNFNAGTYTQVTVSGNPSTALTGLTAETTYYARVRANCGGMYGVSQWSAVCPFMPSAVQTVEIGDDGTSSSQYLPSYNYYNYCISQQIYTSEEIGSPGTIKSISLKNTGEEKTRTYAIYLQETDKETFTSTSDWVAENSGDLVFNGSVTLTSGEWTKITFTNPFVFDGESNLIITVADNTGSYTSSPHMTCLVFDATAMAIYAHRDSPGAYDIAAPGVSGTLLNVKNQIKIDIVPSDGPICPRPNGLAASNVTSSSATLSWNGNAATNDWVLQYGTNNTFAAGTYSEVTVSGTPTTTLTGLTTETEYYARVKAVCEAEEESSWSSVCSFLPTIWTIIGSGSSTSNYLPTNNYYNYSLTQQIYTTAELGAAGDIQSIAFYKNAAIECNRNLDIYMVSTTKSTFSGSTDWITVTAANKVFSGTVNFANNAWTTITLDTPFSYDGTQNIAIIVDDNTGSYKSNTAFRTFTASSQAIRIYNDNTNFTATSPSSYSGTVESIKNQIRLLKVEEQPCPDPTEFSATACESYTWSGVTYSTSGNYTRTFTTSSGCDSVVTLHLTINHATTGDTSAVACGSFTWYGVTYTESGDYTINMTNTTGMTNGAGCDSIVTLHLTINNPVHTAVTVEECEAYTWNGTEYTISGNYSYSHEDAHGCTQVDTLHLTINHPVHTAVTVEECEAYTWNGTEYTISGNYFYSHEDAHGCTQVDTLHLTINHPVHTAVTVEECEAYTWNGTEYPISGNYFYSHEDAHGCTQVDTLHLTINNPVHESTTVTAYDSYTWAEGNGNTYTVSGTYLFSHEDTHGCNQVDTLHLTIHYSSSNDFAATVCESYEWDGVIYTTSGDYTRQYQDIYGADSVVTLHLVVNYGSHHSKTETACEQYSWHDAIYTTSGTYLYEYTNLYGCASVDTLHLTINHATTGDTTAVACENFTWYGVSYTESGNYTTTMTNMAGCDSIVTLHLTINNTTTGDTTATACESFAWYGVTYTESDDYTINMTNVAGCDSVVTLHLTINNATTGDTTAVACENFTWHGVTYTESGNYTTSMTNVAGCDSIVTLHLTINNPVHTAVTVEECESYTWNGTEYTTSGDYLFSHEDAHGCTQVDTLHLTINHAVSTEFTIETSDSCYEWNGVSYCETGHYTQTLTAENGCDSVVTLHLTTGVGIDDHTVSLVYLAPNPTSNICRIVGLSKEPQRVELYDMHGALIQRSKDTELDVTTLVTGVYIVKVFTDGNVINLKLIRQ